MGGVAEVGVLESSWSKFVRLALTPAPLPLAGEGLGVRAGSFNTDNAQSVPISA